TTPGGTVNGAEKPNKDGASRGFRELKEALKILESLKNMTVEQLWTGGSPTSPTSAEPASTANVASSMTPAAPEKPTKEKRFLDDIKKLQENLRKTLDNVAIVEEEKMEAVVETVGSAGAGMEVSVITTVGDDVSDLFSALIKGPTRTPYEDGLFLFDIQLPNIYPAVPPLFRYLSQCSGRLNPNLYDNGKVCVSLLGTWIGKVGAGLILVNEPYYNEAGFDSDRGLQEGYENSRCYNEMALIKMVQSMAQLLQNPVEVFNQEIQQHFVSNGWRLVHRLEAWLELNEAAERGHVPHYSRSHHSKDEQLVAVAHSSPSKPGEEGVPGVSSILEEELEDSGLSPSTTAASQQELSQNSDCDSTQGSAPPGGDYIGSTGPGSVVRSGMSDSGLSTPGLGAGSSSGSQPVVRPKKRRKSYRSFLPEGSGYPDIGFPLFPLSKGFVKSVRGVLQHYRATLAAAGVAEHTEDK
ncbi:hypothetical protein XENOCAPTIV_004381, partial [Xenoophorus captivus]